jgi:hypothetical protein
MRTPMLAYLVLILLASAWVLGENARPKPALASPLQSMTCPQYCARFPVGAILTGDSLSPCIRAGAKKGVNGCNCVCTATFDADPCVAGPPSLIPNACPPGELLELQ